MSATKERLSADLTAAMKARDSLVTAALRMALSAISVEEVAGPAARSLRDEEVLTVLVREVKKRAEAAEAFAAAGRAELAERERAEAAVLERYLPAQLSDQELADIVATAIAATAAHGPAGMGPVMKAVQPQVAGRATGARVAGEVRRQLGAG